MIRKCPELRGNRKAVSRRIECGEAVADAFELCEHQGTFRPIARHPEERNPARKIAAQLGRQGTELGFMLGKPGASGNRIMDLEGIDGLGVCGAALGLSLDEVI